jgi:hypothetical protein
VPCLQSKDQKPQSIFLKILSISETFGPQSLHTANKHPLIKLRFDHLILKAFTYLNCLASFHFNQFQLSFKKFLI